MKSVLVIEFEHDDNTQPPEMWATWQAMLETVKDVIESTPVPGYKHTYVGIKSAAEKALAAVKPE